MTVRDNQNLYEYYYSLILFSDCPPGQYGAVAFDGSTVCVQCPANSMSVSEGSNECGCLQGYYRNDLEDAHFPCSSKVILLY